MIVHDVVQGTSEWRQVRCGIPTASRFHHIYQPQRRKPSKQRDTYLLELVDEWLTGVSDDEYQNKWTQRGRNLEPVARFAYEMEFGNEIQQVGFITRDDGKVGGSPDGLIGSDAILEIKCLSPHLHLGRHNGKPLSHHWAQCQGYLYLCNRSIAYLWYFTDDGVSVRKEIMRDDEYIAGFEECLAEFLNDLEIEKEQCKNARAFVK
jgi:predicted phage-related endonuclease